MAIEQLVLGAVAKRVVDTVFDRLKRLSSSAPPDDPLSDLSSCQSSVQRHLARISNWSTWTQDSISTQQVDLQSHTISIHVHPEIRRLVGDQPRGKALSEQSLLAESHNCILLGDPGAGKTTTMKRIAQALLTEESRSERDDYHYPLLLICRAITSNSGLYRSLAEIIEVQYEQFEKVSFRTERVLKEFPYVDKHGKLVNQKKDARGQLIEEYDERQIRIVDIEDRVGKQPLKHWISDFLNQTQALLLIDGLDELSKVSADRFLAETIELASGLTSAKIIASCRNGSFAGGFEEFSVFQLCALSFEQISKIKDLRLGEHDTKFLEELKGSPISELADRPLFLNYLIVIYERNSLLPKQPTEVYKRVVRLLLEEWDKSRGILRTSKYSLFDPERKREFLSAIAFSLTYERRRKAFSERVLLELYGQHSKKFDLPLKEGPIVAKEIESHSGIIVESQDASWEFSHLVMQEYLCAEYLVRTPVTTKMASRLSEFAAPLAIAVSLASDPSDWFGELVLSSPVMAEWDYANTRVFLSRLVLEAPHFDASENLGLALLRLLHLFRTSHLQEEVGGLIRKLCAVEGITTSINLALKYYVVPGQLQLNGLVEVRRKSQYLGKARVHDWGAFPNWIGVIADAATSVAEPGPKTGDSIDRQDGSRTDTGGW
jgi:DNA polymerase III delta prime subunit